MPRHPNYGRNPKCVIEGCNYAGLKSGLCRRHHAMVPVGMAIQCSVECASTARKIAQRHHQMWAEYVRSQLVA